MEGKFSRYLEYPHSSLAGVVARIVSLRGRMGEAERQVEGLFESMLSESFGGGA